MRDTLGCDGICGFVDPYGFVPECGCPVHDTPAFLALTAAEQCAALNASAAEQSALLRETGSVEHGS